MKMLKKLNASDLNQVVGGGIVCLPYHSGNPDSDAIAIYPTSEGTVLHSSDLQLVAHWRSLNSLSLEEQSRVNLLPETSRRYNCINELELLYWRSNSGILCYALGTTAQPVDIGGNEYALIR